MDQSARPLLPLPCAITILHSLLDACRRANPLCSIININNSESGIALDHMDIRMSAVESLVALQKMASECRESDMRLGLDA